MDDIDNISWAKFSCLTIPSISKYHYPWKQFFMKLPAISKGMKEYLVIGETFHTGM